MLYCAHLTLSNCSTQTPGQKLVTTQWRITLTMLLASRLGLVVLEVDGRGAQGRGEEWRNKLVGRLGEVDVEDQIEAVK